MLPIHDDVAVAERRRDKDLAPMGHGFAKLAESTPIRGPRPPALVCSDCDETIRAHYQNPLLVAARRLGCYRGPPTGGRALCAVCQHAREAREQARRLANVPTVVDLPAPFTDATLESYKRRTGSQAALDLAHAWLTERNRDLYLFGRTGTGKTRLACSLANAVLSKKLVSGAVIFVRAPALLQRLKVAQFDAQRTAGELGRLETYERAGLLVLDDLGAENGTPYTRTTIEMLYTARLDAGRLTILTSNLPLGLPLLEQSKPVEARTYREALGDFLGDDRLASRIAGNAEIVELGGEDYRLRGWQATRRRRCGQDPKL